MHYLLHGTMQQLYSIEELPREYIKSYLLYSGIRWLKEHHLDVHQHHHYSTCPSHAITHAQHSDEMIFTAIFQTYQCVQEHK